MSKSFCFVYDLLDHNDVYSFIHLHNSLYAKQFFIPNNIQMNFCHPAISCLLIINQYFLYIQFHMFSLFSPVETVEVPIALLLKISLLAA